MKKLVPHEMVRDSMWEIWQEEDGRYKDDQVVLAVLMDIRKDLRQIKNTVMCPNCTGIPGVLRKIEKNTRKKTKARKPKAGA